MIRWVMISTPRMCHYHRHNLPSGNSGSVSSNVRIITTTTTAIRQPHHHHQPQQQQQPSHHGHPNRRGVTSPNNNQHMMTTTTVTTTSSAAACSDGRTSTTDGYPTDRHFSTAAAAMTTTTPTPTTTTTTLSSAPTAIDDTTADTTDHNYCNNDDNHHVSASITTTSIRTDSINTDSIRSDSTRSDTINTAPIQDVGVTMDEFHHHQPPPDDGNCNSLTAAVLSSSDRLFDNHNDSDSHSDTDDDDDDDDDNVDLDMDDDDDDDDEETLPEEVMVSQQQQQQQRAGNRSSDTTTTTTTTSDDNDDNDDLIMMQRRKKQQRKKYLYYRCLNRQLSSVPTTAAAAAAAAIIPSSSFSASPSIHNIHVLLDIAQQYCNETKFPIGSLYAQSYIVTRTRKKIQSSPDRPYYDSNALLDHNQFDIKYNTHVQLVDTPENYGDDDEEDDDGTTSIDDKHRLPRSFKSRKINRTIVVTIPVMNHVYETIKELRGRRINNDPHTTHPTTPLELQCRIVNTAVQLFDRIIREEAAMNIMYASQESEPQPATNRNINDSTTTNSDDTHPELPTTTTSGSSSSSTPGMKLNRLATWTLTPFFLSGIVSKWKVATLQIMKEKQLHRSHRQQQQNQSSSSGYSEPQYPKMMSAKEMVHFTEEMTTTLLSTTRNKNQRFAKQHAKFTALYDIVTMNMIMEVIIKQQTDVAKAPYVAQSIFDFILEQDKNHGEQDDNDDDDDVNDVDESTMSNKKKTAFHMKPNIFTYGLLLSAWSHSRLPIAGVKMEEIIDHMRTDPNVPDPSPVVYSTLLRYYSSRGDLAHIHRVLQQMSVANIKPTLDTYGQVLYCCCKNQHMSKAASTLNQIFIEVDRYEAQYQHEKHGIITDESNNDINGDSNAMAFAAFVTDHAGGTVQFACAPVLRVLEEGIFNMLVAYRDAVTSPSSSRELINQYVKDAEQLVARVEKNDFLQRMKDRSGLTEKLKRDWKGSIFDRTTNLMMLIYSRAKRIRDAELLFAKISSNTDLRYHSLIRAYVTSKSPEKATALLHRMIKDKDVTTMTTSCFATVIDAWADAADRRSSDALKNAIQIVQLMDTNERCQEMNLRPCVLVFNSVIKCLSNIKLPNTSEAMLLGSSDGTTVIGSEPPLDPCLTAIEILDEMEERGKLYKPAMPNQITYTLVVKTCFRNNRLELADEILRRMEASDTPPDIRTYVDILLHYSSAHTTAGAKQTENILEYIKYLSLEKPQLKPDVVCYSILLNAWLDSGATDAADQAWRVYEMLRKDGVHMDLVFASRIISYLSSYSVNSPSYFDTKQQPLFSEPVGFDSSSVSLSSISTSSSSLAEVPSSTPINLRRAVIVLDDLERNMYIWKQKPNERFYKLIIRGFLEINDLVTATSMLLRMIESYVNGSNTYAKPNEYLFQIVVLAWIQYGDLIKATLLLNKLSELYCSKQIPTGPNMGTFHALLSHWNQSLHPKKELYLSQLKYHMQQVDLINNPTSLTSMEEMSVFDATTTTPDSSSMDSNNGNIQLPAQTFLATAMAAIKRQS